MASCWPLPSSLGSDIGKRMTGTLAPFLSETVISASSVICVSTKQSFISVQDALFAIISISIKDY